MHTSDTLEILPKHVGIILDGNRRWAKKQGLKVTEGHFFGYRRVKEAIDWFIELGIPYLTVYVFSMENWNRPQIEVDILMNLLRHALRDNLDSFKKKQVQLRVIGKTELLPQDLQRSIVHAVESTKQYNRLVLTMAISYDGRTEILDAAKRFAQDCIEGTVGDLESFSEKDFENYLWTQGMPNPDLIIRTSGETRLSGFLLWQGSYSELAFISSPLPAFSKEEFMGIISMYGKRARRFGR